MKCQSVFTPGLSLVGQPTTSSLQPSHNSLTLLDTWIISCMAQICAFQLTLRTNASLQKMSYENVFCHQIHGLYVWESSIEWDNMVNGWHSWTRMARQSCTFQHWCSTDCLPKLCCGTTESKMLLVSWCYLKKYWSPPNCFLFLLYKSMSSSPIFTALQVYKRLRTTSTDGEACTK